MTGKRAEVNSLRCLHRANTQFLRGARHVDTEVRHALFELLRGNKGTRQVDHRAFDQIENGSNCALSVFDLTYLMIKQNL